MAICDCIPMVICFVIIADQSINMINGGVCHETKRHKILFADCRYLGLKEIPKDLLKNVQSLDISYNPISEIKEDSFLRYPSLMNLTLIYVSKRSININAKAFARIQELRYLKIMNVDLSRNPMLVFPVSLNKLILNGCGLENDKIDIQSLSKLKVLQLPYNELRRIPEFHPNAPLKLINMFMTELSILDVVYLGKYCLLQALVFKVPKNWDMYNDSCGCLSIQEWLSYTKVKQFENFYIKDCRVSEKGVACANNLKAKMIENYSKCQENVSKKDKGDDYDFYHYENEDKDEDEAKPSFKFILILIILSILIIIVIISVLIYKKHIRRKKGKSKSSIESDQYNQKEEVETVRIVTDEETLEPRS